MQGFIKKQCCVGWMRFFNPFLRNYIPSFDNAFQEEIYAFQRHSNFLFLNILSGMKLKMRIQSCWKLKNVGEKNGDFFRIGLLLIFFFIIAKMVTTFNFCFQSTRFRDWLRILFLFLFLFGFFFSILLCFLIDLFFFFVFLSLLLQFWHSFAHSPSLHCWTHSFKE